MNLELPEYFLLAIAVALGIGIRHWWKNRRRPEQESASSMQER